MDADIERRRKRATPYRIVLKAGEVLYLPSLWYHAVGQKATPSSEGTTIAINFWCVPTILALSIFVVSGLILRWLDRYSMQYDSRYAHFRFMEAIAALKQANRL